MPDHPEEEAKVQDSVGVAYERAGDLDRALSYYTRAVQLAPKYVGGHRNRSLVLARKNRLNDALDEIGKAIQLDPWNGELHYVPGTYWPAGGGTRRPSPSSQTRSA